MDDKKSAKSVAFGIIGGVVLGTVVGVFINNIPMGVAVGTGLGAAVGVSLTVRQNNYKTTTMTDLNKTSMYRHTQIGYLMLLITLAVLALFVWIQITARAEPPSVDSGTNFVVTVIMVLILCILASFATLTTYIDEKYLRIKFGYGIFKKKFLLSQIVSTKAVKNRWYYGFGIRVWFKPYMWIYNVSGLNAVEIHMENGKIYRIGTNEPKELESAVSTQLTNRAQ